MQSFREMKRKIKMEESGPRTPSEWSLSFHVNLRREKQSYKVNDFRTSTLRICDYTSDLDKLLCYLNTIPSIQEMVQGSISLFRDNIENLWEDPKNEGGTILRFMCCKKGVHRESEIHGENNDQERQDTQKRFMGSAPNSGKYTSQKSQTPTPVLEVEKITDLWKLLLALILSSAFEKSPSEQSSRAINGIYCKVSKEGTVTFEIWFSSYGGSNSKQKTVNSVKSLLTDIFNSPELKDYESGAESEGKGSGISIASTFKVTELILNAPNKHKAGMRSSMSH
eukprot:XP_001709521.1 Hypothetical protein GL50803_96264 [Giardia lamblia ATCC 50803]